MVNRVSNVFLGSVYLFLGLSIIASIFSFFAWFCLLLMAIMNAFFYVSHKNREDRVVLEEFKFKLRIANLLLGLLLEKDKPKRRKKNNDKL